MIAQNRAGVNISKVEIGDFSQLFVENSLNHRLWTRLIGVWAAACGRRVGRVSVQTALVA